LYGVGNQELQVFLSYESNSVRMIKRKKMIWGVVVGGEAHRRENIKNVKCNWEICKNYK
jgi:hypothetical protein